MADSKTKVPKTPRAHDFLMKEIDKLRRPGYTAQYNLVLRDIVERINKRSKDAWPSIATIAKRTWISERQVSKIIGVLEQDGILKVERRDHSTSRYSVVLDNQEFMQLYADANQTLNNEIDDSYEWDTPRSENSSPRSENSLPPFRELPPPVLSTGVPPFGERPNLSIEPLIGISHGNLSHEPQPGSVRVEVSGFHSSSDVKSNSNNKDNNNDKVHRKLSLPDSLVPSAPPPQETPHPPSYSELVQLEADILELFPEMKIDELQDLADLLTENNVTPGRVRQVLRFLKDKSTTNWKNELAKADSQYLLINFANMYATYQNFLASIKKRREGNG